MMVGGIDVKRTLAQVSGHSGQWLGEGALTAEYCHDRTGQESTIGVCVAPGQSSG
jgi:hypothetical protein